MTTTRKKRMQARGWIGTEGIGDGFCHASGRLQNARRPLACHGSSRLYRVMRASPVIPIVSIVTASLQPDPMDIEDEWSI